MFLHSIGLYFLIRLYKRYEGDVQQLYIINLCIVELIATVLFMVGTLLNVVPLLEAEKYHEYISMVTQTVIRFVFYMSMVAITVDKLVVVLLSIKYHVYWSVNKAKYLVATIWMVGLIMCVTVITVYLVEESSYELQMDKFVLTFDFAFISIAISSYSYIFYKYKQTRASPIFNSASTPQQSIWKVFKNSRFFISVLLITSFLLLIVLPDLVDYFINNNTEGEEEDEEDSAGLILFILYHISFICDSCIYIFIQPKVRRLLWKKLYRFRYLPKQTENSLHLRLAAAVIGSNTRYESSI